MAGNHDDIILRKQVSPTEIVPLISLSSELWNANLNSNLTQTVSIEHQKIGDKVVKALQTSGFLLIQSDLMPTELQKRALEDATGWLLSKQTHPMVIEHPTDPKTYVMLEAKHVQEKEGSTPKDDCLDAFTPTLLQYWKACEQVKTFVLRAIGIGLKLGHPEDLASWHSQGTHSAMRLLHYPPATRTTGNRCKPHSDYGAVTLLSTDGVSGLEIFLEGQWWPVPHIPGSMVVNIGSLLSEWTQQGKGHPPLLATLHRVAGPASDGTVVDPQVLQEAAARGRTSIAFFADPDDGSPLASDRGMTMEEYIQWRSGGSDANRSGVAFTEMEKDTMLVVFPNGLD